MTIISPRSSGLQIRRTFKISFLVTEIVLTKLELSKGHEFVQKRLPDFSPREAAVS